MATFLFDYHVMHDDARIHDVGDDFLVPETRRTFHDCPPRLEHPKSPLHILPRGLLLCRKQDSPLTNWAADRLQKNRPPWVYAIGQVVPHMMCAAVGSELNGRTATPALIGE